MQIDPLGRRPTQHEDAPEAPRRDPDATVHVSHAHETLLDGTAKLYAQNATRGVQANGAAPAFNDEILYVGMNSTVLHGIAQNVREAHNLGTFGVTKIEHAEDGPDAPDHVRVNGRVFDLTTPDGRAGFTATLGLPAAQAKAIDEVLEHAGRGSRDELAGIATVWARAERGGTIPSRLVVSGHCYGTSVWDGNSGKNDGELTFDSIQRLADAMPRAASQIEDVMIAACNSGHDDWRSTKLPSWSKHFPNLQTAWAYSADDSHAPTEAHAVSHIAAWRAATAGRTTHIDGAAAVRAEYRREGAAAFAAENVATWTTADGYRKGI